MTTHRTTRRAAAVVGACGVLLAAGQTADAAPTHATAAAQGGTKAAPAAVRGYCTDTVAGTSITVNTYLSGNVVEVTVDTAGASTTIRNSTYTYPPTHSPGHLGRSHHQEWYARISPAGGTAHVVGALQPARKRWVEDCPVG